MSSVSFLNRAIKYSKSVTRKSRPIPACIYVKLACSRFLSDLKRKEFIMDEKEVDKWCNFLEMLPHVKGEWANNKEKLKLSDWQIFCVVNVYGFYFKYNGRRRFREVYIEVPRKNGKTFFFSGLGIGMMTIENEFGAEIYCGATTEKQAWEVFRPAKRILERTPNLRAAFGITVNAKTLNKISNDSRFEPVIGIPHDGASPSCGIVDEYHEHKTSEVPSTFRTGMAARKNPLLLIITTAGSNMGSPCYDSRLDLIKILKKTEIDDRLFGIIYTIDDGDDWSTIKAQKKANPNYGISVDPDYLDGQLIQAKRSPLKQAEYRTKHINQWIGAKSAWMNMLSYEKCTTELVMEDRLGDKCYLALDLASKLDVAALVALFPPTSKNSKWSVFAFHYLPEDTIAANDMYKAWHAEGWLTATDGSVIDYDAISDDMRMLKSNYQVQEVPYDPFQATQFALLMQKEGFPMIEYGATVKNFSEPMKKLEELIVDNAIEFQKDPVLKWMFGNVTAKLDLKDNIFPNKERPENKIDGVVAIIMGLARATLHETHESIYKSRGLIVL